MRHMMTTSEVAARLGVTPNAVLRAVKRTGMRWTLGKMGAGAYAYSNDDVAVLARAIKRRTLPPATYTPDNGE